jgi:hypothetical protein
LATSSPLVRLLRPNAEPANAWNFAIRFQRGMVY